MADNRSESCNGVGVTTPAIRCAALSMSAAHSVRSPRALGVWLSSADTGQWCHQTADSPHRGQYEHRNLPVGLLLVPGVVRPGRDRAFPPDRLLVAEDLAGVVVMAG